MKSSPPQAGIGDVARAATAGRRSASRRKLLGGADGTTLRNPGRRLDSSAGAIRLAASSGADDCGNHSHRGIAIVKFDTPARAIARRDPVRRLYWSNSGEIAS